MKPYEEMFPDAVAGARHIALGAKFRGPTEVRGGAKHNLTLLNVTSAALARKISRVAPRRFEFRSKLSLTAIKFREIDAHFRLSHQPTSFERGLS